MNKNTKRIIGLILIVTLSGAIGFLIWRLWPTPTLDVALTSVNVASQITEGEANTLVINLKNNSNAEFNSNLNFKWIPDPNGNGSPILVPLGRVRLLAKATHSTDIKIRVEDEHVSTYKRFIPSKFELSGDQNNENNQITKEINYYKKSQTSSFKERLPDNVTVPPQSFTVRYKLDGKQITKRFNSRAELMRASIPKEVENLKIGGNSVQLNRGN